MADAPLEPPALALSALVAAVAVAGGCCEFCCCCCCGRRGGCTEAGAMVAPWAARGGWLPSRPRSSRRSASGLATLAAGAIDAARWMTGAFVCGSPWRFRADGRPSSCRGTCTALGIPVVRANTRGLTW
jgi:hypothetical protein